MDKHLTNQELERNYNYAKESLRWYGWGSPVGLGLFLLSIGVFIWLLHLASIIE